MHHSLRADVTNAFMPRKCISWAEGRASQIPYTITRSTWSALPPIICADRSLFSPLTSTSPTDTDPHCLLQLILLQVVNWTPAKQIFGYFLGGPHHVHLSLRHTCEQNTARSHPEPQPIGNQLFFASSVSLPLPSTLEQNS